MAEYFNDLNKGVPEVLEYLNATNTMNRMLKTSTIDNGKNRGETGVNHSNHL